MSLCEKCIQKIFHIYRKTNKEVAKRAKNIVALCCILGYVTGAAKCKAWFSPQHKRKHKHNVAEDSHDTSIRTITRRRKLFSFLCLRLCLSRRYGTENNSAHACVLMLVLLASSPQAYACACAYVVVKTRLT